jgi:hypothetical protein
MARVEWQAYYFASLYVSSPSARTEPNEAEGEDDPASVAGFRMDLSKPDDMSARIAESPGHCAVLAPEELPKAPALH